MDSQLLTQVRYYISLHCSSAHLQNQTVTYLPDVTIRNEGSIGNNELSFDTEICAEQIENALKIGNRAGPTDSLWNTLYMVVRFSSLGKEDL